MYLSKSDCVALFGILSAIGGLGIYEGYEVRPVFYSQSAIIFGSAGYIGYRLFAEKEPVKSPA